MYGKPVANPPIFKNFTDIPSIGNSLKIANLTDHVAGTDQGYGFRQSYWTATFKNDAALQGKILTIWQEEIALLKAVSGWVPAAIFQPLSTGFLGQSPNGGNSFGLNPADGPLIRKSHLADFKYHAHADMNLVFNTALQWNNIADDVKVLAAGRNIINRSVAEAKARGLSFRYIYQNYAAAEQNVFEGYGSANHAKLRAISQKYDPEGVFQTLQPGYFKLW